MAMMRRLPLLALLAVLCIAPQAASPDAMAAGPAPDAVVPLPESLPGGFAPPPARQAGPPAAMTEAKASLATAKNAPAVLKMLKLKLSEDQKRFLDENRFLLVPKRSTAYAGRYDFDNCAFQESFDEMLGMFDQVCGESSIMLRRPENARFVGPDIVLHAMAKYFENALEHLEKTELLPLLTRFVAELRAQALAQAKASDGPLAGHLETVAAQLTVPLVLLETVKPAKAQATGAPPRGGDAPDAADALDAALTRLAGLKKDFPPQTAARLEAELRLVHGAKAVETSPLFGGYDPTRKTDYTQYRPRGHYAKNSRLRGYFRAMMYLGRNGWPLAAPDGMTDALLVARLLAAPGSDGQPLAASWRRLMDVTGFFAGLPDDTDYAALRGFLLAVLGRDGLSLADAVDPAVLAALGGRLDPLPAPRIHTDVLVDPANGEKTKQELLDASRSLRLLGQRFSPDAWILSRLTAGQENAGLRLPSMPTGLFVPAALGNAAARAALPQFLAGPGQGFSQAEVAAFMGRLDATAKSLAALGDADWYGSLAGAWLHVLATLKTGYGQGWPAYMQSGKFPAKRLESFMGSFTELKHATVLYAKQNLAEAGDGEEEGKPPPAPKGFVEPDPAFWSAMLRLVDTAVAGFTRYGLLPDEVEEYGRLAMFRRDIAFYADLAGKELANKAISADDYERLRVTGLSYVNRPFEDVILEPDQCKSALTADIHTDAVAGQVLYEATAEPYVMLVLVGNEQSPRLTVGTAFNQYEFTRPLAAGRLTDAAWQAGVYARPPKLPVKNGWYKDLLAQ